MKSNPLEFEKEAFVLECGDKDFFYIKGKY